MARARTGQLVYRAKSGWNARAWMPVKNEDGTVGEERKFFPLDTHDEDLAKRKLAKIVAGLASGELVPDAVKREVAHVATFGEEKISWVASRKAAKVVQAPDEERMLDDHAMKRLGVMRLTEIRSERIRSTRC